jgi:hypothetical protein
MSAVKLLLEEKLEQEHLEPCAGCALCESDEVVEEGQEYEDYKNSEILAMGRGR